MTATTAAAAPPRAAPARSSAAAAWLFVVAALVVGMIVVGGLTRLTDSGLSITEWKPVTGALPPMNAEAWDAEFAKYRTIPEYQRQNAGMTLEAFKRIYWWEWTHRLLGRLIGVVFALPLIAFWAMGAIPKGLKTRLLALFALGGLQGAVGWWMVASGLVDRVDVSQHRLAVHLSVAFLILAVAWWTALDARAGLRAWRANRAARIAGALLALVSLQIVLGAYVAGLDGGRIATGWPLVDGRLIPATYGALSPAWRNLVDNPVTAQIDHRFLGYLVVAAALAAGAWIARGSGRDVGALGWLVGALALGQAGLGVVTLVHAAPVALSAAHQLGAVALFLATLTLVRAAGRADRTTSPP